jgi:ABC-type glucose/galactose transport system permease subunit
MAGVFSGVGYYMLQHLVLKYSVLYLDLSMTWRHIIKEHIFAMAINAMAGRL